MLFRSEVKRRQCSLFPPQSSVGVYTFSGQTNVSLNTDVFWDHPVIRAVRGVMVAHASWPVGAPYFIHINLMPGGAGVAPHSDSDPSIIAPNSDIVAVSMMNTDTDVALLDIVDDVTKRREATFRLRHGDVYIMKGGMQESTKRHGIRHRCTKGTKRISFTGRLLAA